MKDKIMNTVSFATQDNVTIVGDYFKADLPIAHTILALHMMPADRTSWGEFAAKANQAGYDVLAIDLRGHGESVKQRNQTLNFQQFTDQQHQDSIKDIEAAVKFLNQQGVYLDKLTLIGASIGANLALNYLQTHQEINAGVLLSPGLNYRGIATDKTAAKLSSSQSILLIAGQQDDYPYQSVLKLKSLLPGSNETMILPSSAHGTNLFIDHPRLITKILSWLNEPL